MKIQSLDTTSFNGYNARPLKGFLMCSNSYGIADEMYKIGQKEGFKVFMPYQNTILETPYKKSNDVNNLWAQDYWTIIKGKLFSLNSDLAEELIKKTWNLKYEEKENKNAWSLFADLALKKEEIDDFKDVFELERDALIEEKEDRHIPGGNLFVISKKTIIIGQDELQKFSIDEIKSMYDVKRVIILPQMDYHLDLFIRPLDKNRVLLADDNMAASIFKDGLKKLSKYLLTLPPMDAFKYQKQYMKISSFINNFEFDMNFQVRPKTDCIEKILKENGFKVTRVPGRVYETDDRDLLRQYCNYMNANVLVNKDGELVYITNKSDINKKSGFTKELMEKTGFDFEKSFVNSISRYVKPEHVYFVDGDDNFVSKSMLKTYLGGIHCACAEVPCE